MLTSEFLTTQSRICFHELKKEVRDILLHFDVSNLHIYKTKLSQIKLHFSLTRKDSCLERLRE